MKKLWLITTAVHALLVAPALAADLPIKAPRVVAAPIAYNWAGFYIGGHAGYGRTDSRIDANSVPVSNNNVDFPVDGALVPLAATLGTAFWVNENSGFLAGGQVGYNYQYGALVIGIEADLTHLSDTKNTNVYSVAVRALYQLDSHLASEYQLDWLGTVRARLGTTLTPTILGYLTGGLAYGKVSTSFAMVQNHESFRGISTGTSSGTSSEVQTGWTLGGGIEWAFAPRFTLRAEYLYYDLGSDSYNASNLNSAFADGTARYSIGTSITSETSGSLFRTGLNLKF